MRLSRASLARGVPHADLSGGRARARLRARVLPEDDPVAIERHLAAHDRRTATRRPSRATSPASRETMRAGRV
jgi:hypothetical protein